MKHMYTIVCILETPTIETMYVGKMNEINAKIAAGTM